MKHCCISEKQRHGSKNVVFWKSRYSSTSQTKKKVCGSVHSQLTCDREQRRDAELVGVLCWEQRVLVMTPFCSRGKPVQLFESRSTHGELVMVSKGEPAFEISSAPDVARRRFPLLSFPAPHHQLTSGSRTRRDVWLDRHLAISVGGRPVNGPAINQSFGSSVLEAAVFFYE